MKTVNGIPQFDETNDKSAASWFNQILRDYFSKRVCVYCKHYRPDYDERGEFCYTLGLTFNSKLNPESFSCSAFEEKK